MAFSFGINALLAAVFVLFLTLGQGEGLRCWLCSSESNPSCADPFNATSRVPKYALVDCDARASSAHQQFYQQQRAVCRKSIRLVREERVTTRGCAWVSMDNVGDDCIDEKTPSFVKIESCSSCTTDACNGAPATVGASLAAAIATAVLARFA
uniref:Putative conserved secreted protein n=1 Tax=Xenopsylla cheopis TaxID=163159 RepID=A0A6M2DYB7_XENCH